MSSAAPVVESPKATAPKLVEKFTHRRVVVSPAAVPSGAPPGITIPAVSEPQQKLVEKLSAHLPKGPKLRMDGPTLEEYLDAGYDAENYPPEGYAPRLKVYQFAKLRGTMALTVFPDGTKHQWLPIPRHGGGYHATTSFETSDAALAAKLREAAKTDTSIREAPAR